MEWIADPQVWIGLLTLTVLEIVLGIDNIIFISILSSALPRAQQPRARRIGLMGAFVTRILLLLSIAWIVRLTTPLFTVAGVGFSGRALILLIGGLFLIGKATYEIHEKLEGDEHAAQGQAVRATMSAVVIQIMLVDIVFSLDSVITAVGMVTQVEIMIAANVVALGVMLLAATPISDFVDQHPTIKVLALAFLVLIGSNLVAEGLGHHIPKGYTYFAMAFSFAVEMINLRMRAARRDAAPDQSPVKLRNVPRVADAGMVGAGGASAAVASSGGGAVPGGAAGGGRRRRRRNR
ncbi:MAG: TerC family protein [Gemmatimonadetes bacterium]|nr:TerC family protein [Gemmatimonadota bacterium]MCC6769966.1 TerC family protein [Gemmatimonadaceae bacterium]